MSQDKTMSLEAAVGQIENGETIAAGLALEHAIPFAAGHELIRQGARGLTLVGPISDLLFDQLVGAGCVDQVRAAWVGNVSAGIGYCFRRAVEAGDLAVENHSNFSIALALKAGALGVPYLPTRSLLGSDILAESDTFRTAEDPFSGEPLVLVPAIHPDWAIVHVQRASPAGDVHFWGNTGVTEAAAGAADKVLVTAEEIVDPEVIKSDPSRTLFTRENVAAVAEVLHGAHPSPVAGRYNRDNQYYLDYHDWTDEPEGYEEWVDEWVHDVDSREAYMRKIDRDLSLSDDSVAAEVTYGQ
jgi:glutaconate CoA-transferase subunit A